MSAPPAPPLRSVPAPSGSRSFATAVSAGSSVSAAFHEKPSGAPVPLSASKAPACFGSSRGVPGGVALPARQAALLVRVEDDADRPPGPAGALGDESRRLDRDRAAGAVVDGARPEVPRVEVARDDDDLVRLLAPRHLADHVRRGRRAGAAGSRGRASPSRGRGRGAARGGRHRRSRRPPRECAALRRRSSSSPCARSGSSRSRSTGRGRRARRAARPSRRRRSASGRSHRSPVPAPALTIRRLKKTIFPRTASGSAFTASSSASSVFISTTGAMIPSVGVPTLPPSAVTTSFWGNGETTSAVSTPRSQAVTGTSSARTFAKPSSRKRACPHATAARSPGEPARRGPTSSVSRRTHSVARVGRGPLRRERGRRPRASRAGAGRRRPGRSDGERNGEERRRGAWGEAPAACGHGRECTESARGGRTTSPTGVCRADPRRVRRRGTPPSPRRASGRRRAGGPPASGGGLRRRAPSRSTRSRENRPVSSESAAPRASRSREASAGKRLPVDVADDHGVLVAAVARDEVLRTRRVEEGARGAQEEAVSGQVAPRVVPLLEAVDVGEEEPEAPPLAPPERVPPLRDLAVQRIAVPETRPRVGQSREPVAPHLFRHPPEDGGGEAEEEEAQEDDAPRRVEIRGSRSRDEARDGDDREEERHVAREIGPRAPAAAPRGDAEPDEEVDEESRERSSGRAAAGRRSSRPRGRPAPRRRGRRRREGGGGSRAGRRPRGTGASPRSSRSPSPRGRRCRPGRRPRGEPASRSRPNGPSIR